MKRGYLARLVELRPDSARRRVHPLHAAADRMMTDRPPYTADTTSDDIDSQCLDFVLRVRAADRCRDGRGYRRHVGRLPHVGRGSRPAGRGGVGLLRRRRARQ